MIHTIFFSATTQNESPVGLDQSAEDDDDSSDYFADAEASSCGSPKADTRCPETSENKGRFVCPKRASPKYMYAQPLILATAVSSKGSSFPSSTMQWTAIPWFTFHHVDVSRYLLIVVVSCIWEKWFLVKLTVIFLWRCDYCRNCLSLIVLLPLSLLFIN